MNIDDEMLHKRDKDSFDAGFDAGLKYAQERAKDEFIDEAGPLPTCERCGLVVGVCDCPKILLLTEMCEFGGMHLRINCKCDPYGDGYSTTPTSPDDLELEDKE